MIDDDTLVVLAHGWSPINAKKLFNNGLLATPPAAAMYFFANKLRKKGLDVLQLVYQDSKHRSISELSASTKSALKQYQNKKLVFIGHSMGGLIGYSIQDIFESATYIATPFRGSRFSPPKSFSVSASEMAKDSDFLSTLPERPSVPSLAIVSSYDALVSRESSVGPCRESQIIPNTTHLSVLFTPRTVEEVNAWIGNIFYSGAGRYSSVSV